MESIFESTWDDNDCSLNIVIGPKVVDTTFKVTLAFLNLYTKTPKSVYSINLFVRWNQF